MGFSDVIFSFLICALFLVVVIPLFLVLSIPLMDEECREAWAWKIQREWKAWKQDLVSDDNKRRRAACLHKLASQTGHDSKSQTEGSHASTQRSEEAEPGSAGFGENNVIFTKERAEAARTQNLLVYASMWERLKAFICDFAVVFSAVGLLVVGVNGIEKPAFTGTLILIAYMILTQWTWHTTIGKYLFGLEVHTVSPNRRYPSFWALLSRETGGRLVSMPLLCAGYWSGIGNPRSQAWSDRIAGTIVVKRPTTARIKGLLKALVIVSLLFVICVCGAYVYSLTARF